MAVFDSLLAAAGHDRRAALIDEARCIGCTLCIQACPVDAIIGAPQQMHTVLTELCIGCELCLPPCPVDCIGMVPATGGDAAWDRSRADAARSRYERRQVRLSERADRAGRQRRRAAPEVGAVPPETKRAAVRGALDRARARRAAHAARLRAKR